MAAQHALGGQRGATLRAVAFNGCDRVVRTGRIEAAGSAEERSEQELIRAQGEKEQTRGQVEASRGGGTAANALLSSSTSSRSIWGNGAVATELRG